MSEQNTDKEFLEKAHKQVEDYISLRYKLFKIEVGEKAARISASVFSILILIFLLFFSVLFVSLVAGFYFAELLNSNLAGFGIIALFYLVVFLIAFFFKKEVIQKPAINKIINEIFDDYE